jgi:putative ABC transport system permease protein
MELFAADLRYALRMLARMRGVTAVAVLTLAVGIGATTAIFSVVYAALLRPLPFPDPDRLVMLYVTRTSAKDGLQRTRWSSAEIAAVSTRLSSVPELASFTQTVVNLTGDGDPERISGEVVSPGYFNVLRVAPQSGRALLAEDEQADRAVALISARLWKRRFATDPAIHTRSIGINGVPLAIVGVLPEQFSGLSGRAEFWITTTMAPRLTYTGYLTTPQHFINLIGRLSPDATIAHAAAELAAIGPAVVRPETSSVSAERREHWSATAWPLRQARIDAGVRRSALLLLAAVACVLLIACVNVASLMLARGRSRRREIAIRLAMGSSRWRIVRQLLTESVLIAAAGGLCGTVLAVWGVGLVSLPDVIPSSQNSYAQVDAFAVPAVDGVVLVFACAITLATSVLFGLAPALDATRSELVSALNEEARGATGVRQRRVLASLAIVELALAVPLLAGAGLLVKSFDQMQSMRAGFEPAGVLSFWVNPPQSRYADADGPAIVERLLTRVQQVPGVTLAAVNRCTPFAPSCARTTLLQADHPLPPGAARPVIERHYVSADYFRTLGIPLRAGRALGDQDRAGRPLVTVINDTAARRFWPGENPIGKRVEFGGGSTLTNLPIEVVGIVGDVKYGPADEAIGPDFYTSYLQFTYPQTLMVVKSHLATSALLPSLRRAIASVDPELPIFDVMTMDERMRTTLSRPRFNAAIVAAFAAAALLLAAIGVYGVMAYTVSARTHEIGVRVALGADRLRVLRLVLGESARLAAAGTFAGLLAALASTRLLQALLFGVAATDPAILAGVAVSVVAVALIAAFVPARRASAVDPMVALRE